MKTLSFAWLFLFVALSLLIMFGCSKDNGSPVSDNNGDTSETEVDSTTWIMTYIDSLENSASALVLTPDSCIVFAGEVSNGTGGTAVLLVKTDSLGNELWSRTFGGTDQDAANDLRLLPDGGFAMAGVQKKPFADGWRDMWLIRTDADGNENWNAFFGGTDSEEASGMELTMDGGFILVGSTYSGDEGFDVFLVKTDADGNTEWSKTPGGDGNDLGRAVLQTSEAEYVYIGSTSSWGAGGNDVLLVKTDSEGRVYWSVYFGGPGNEQGFDLLPMDDGGYLLLCETSTDTASTDIMLIRTDADGNELWSQTFGGPGTDNARRMRRTSDGGVIIVGSTESFGAGGKDLWLIKTDIDGNELWNSAIGTSRDEWGEDVVEWYGGGFIATGWADIQGIGMQSFLIKTDEDGQVSFSLP